jgi:ABC-2 type transport system permease protein
MTRLAKIMAVETKLFFRDTSTWLVSLLLPTVILGVLGTIPVVYVPSEAFGGHRFIDVFIPSLVVMTLAMLGVNTLPIRLTTYREKGVLRRLSTTPVRPATLLVAQLVLNMAVALASLVLLIVVGKLACDVPLPQDFLGFMMAYLLGMSSLFTLGLLVAAIAPTARAGTALAMPIFALVMFLGGVYFPRMLLPDFVIRLGDYTPPGVQALLDSWAGTAPQPLQLAVMAAITLVAGVASARLFRWQ